MKRMGKGGHQVNDELRRGAGRDENFKPIRAVELVLMGVAGIALCAWGVITCW